jgi:GNAT superfamily N-acetyltransferase
VEIARALPEQAETLAQLQRAASLAAFSHIFQPDLFPFPIDDVRRRWRDALADPAAHVFVATVDTETVGLACVHPEWLDGLYVVPERWGGGIGRLLHDRALEQVRDLGSRSCHLWVLEANERARGFYERHGWRENGDTRVVPFPPHPLDVGYTIELDF